MRVRLVLAGLPRPVPQFPVRLKSGLGAASGRRLAGVPGRCRVRRSSGMTRMAHATWTAAREQADQRAEWLILHATKHRMGRGFPGFVREIRDALIARGWRP